MTNKKTLLAILDKLRCDVTHLDEMQLNQVTDAIYQANRIFVMAVGRSGFAARAFANRLGHLGKEIYVVGECTTPPVSKKDLLIVGSGSGETSSLVAIAHKAHQIGVDIVLFTICANSTIAKMARYVVVVPGSSPKIDQKVVEDNEVQVMGSTFEQLCWLIYDSIVIALRDRSGQSNEELFARHTNLE